MKLTLGSPLKTIKINQYFGANATSIYKTQGMVGHNGIDLYALNGTPVFAMHDGLAYTQVDSDGGHGIIIISNDLYEFKDGSYRIKSIYWHLCNPIDQPNFISPIEKTPWGKQVKKGDLIGYADNTGKSTGSHLHLAIKRVNGPEQGYSNVDQLNGYYGASDPLPYFETDSLPSPDSPKPQLTWYEKFLIGLKLAGVEWKDGKYQYLKK